MNCFFALNESAPTQYVEVCFTDTLSVNQTAGNDTISASFFEQFAMASDLDQLWVLLAACLVFFMQCGFTLLEAGAVKSINVQNILFKNTMDACIGAIVWYLFGYCVAYGDADSPNANGFLGVDNVVLESGDWNGFFFQWAFAATAATIVSGSVAERCSLEAYFFYTICLTTWVYPVVVHWMWDGHGWLSPFNADPAIGGGVIDFAGSGVVHMVGGFSGLCGAIMCGPRFRRFDDSDDAKNSKYYAELQHQFEFGHNVPFQVFGTLILWMGWYGFNCGSTLAANGAMDLASRVAVTSTLAAAAGGVTAALLGKLKSYLANRKSGGYWSIPRVCNGILGGLVSITAGCAVVETGWAVFIGVVGACVYYGCSELLVRLKIDDPLDAFPVHGCCGAWGVIAASLFGYNNDYVISAYGTQFDDTGADVGTRIGSAFLAVLCIALWTMVNSGTLFFILRRIGILRVSSDTERSGLDLAEHGGKAVSFGKVYSVPTKKKPGSE